MREFLRRRRPLPIVLYPLATPLAAIIQLWAAATVHPLWLIRPVLLTVLACLVITIAATAAVADRDRAGIIAWATLVGFVVDDLRLSVLLWLMAALLLAAGMVQRGQTWKSGATVSRGLSVLAGVLIVMSIGRAVLNGALGAASDEVMFDMSLPALAATFDSAAPDIYLLLLDAYPGHSAATHEPTFDADAFPAALEARGFDVALNPRANYQITRLTLPSMFAARHLPDIPGLRAGTREEDARILRRITDGGVVLSALGSAGYERIAVSSGYGEIGPIRVDRLLISPQLNEMEAALLRSTGSGDLLDLLEARGTSGQAYRQVLYAMRTTAGLAAEPHERPRMVFVHVPAPHWPWVTDAEGRILTDGPWSRFGTFEMSGGSLETRRRQYFGYSAHIADLAVAMIDEIIARSPRPSVIAVFSDHGPDYDFDSHDPLGSDLELRTSNFLAVLTPDRRDVMPDDATLVNLFPYILNPYLGMDLQVQPDSVWAWRTQSSILDFIEVDPGTWKAK